MTARTKALLLVALAAILTGAIVARGGDSASGASRASATAEAFKRSGSSGQSGYVAVDGSGTETGEGTSVSASTAGGRGLASARVDLGGVNIFSGLVTASSLRVEARAAGGATQLSGYVDGLAIAGNPVGSSKSAATYDLGGYGTLQVLASDGQGITALRATLTKDYKGHPAGSSQSFGFARATATDGAPPAAAERPAAKRGEQRRTRRPRRASSSAAGRRRASESARDEGPPVDEPADRRRAPDLDALPTDRGYVFPVFGEYGFSDQWGAPRANTGTHEGTDIFGSTGTPVLAATDGVLYRVGTRAIPGNRLWLRAPGGDTFFYAHMAAFAQDARNGARVRAGDVIGFVGSTGDAQQTPPHLHFEIHPQDGGAVNPYPFLRAWEARRDVPQAAWLARYGNDPGSRPGALVVIDDYLER